MKRAVILIVAIFAFGAMSAQQSVEKTLIKPVNLLGSTEVDALLDGDIQVKEWSSDHAKIEMTIKAYGVNSHVLKSLVANGRYNISVDKEDGKIVLSTPNLAQALKLRGNSLKDEVSFILYVPEYTVVNTKQNDGMTSVN